MKYLLITLLLILLLPAAHACGQEIPSVDRSGTDVPYEPAAAYGRTARKEKPAYKQTVYWGRYKALKATGWTAFSLGIAATVVGVFGGAIEEYASGKDPAVWDAISYTGLGLVAASIPTLIVAYANKNKAYRVSLGADCIATPVVVGSNRREVQPALALRFNF